MTKNIKPTLWERIYIPVWVVTYAGYKTTLRNLRKIGGRHDS